MLSVERLAREQKTTQGFEGAQGELSHCPWLNGWGTTGRDERADHQLQEPPFPTADHRPCGLAVFLVSVKPAAGGRNAAGAQHCCVLRNDPALGPKIWCGLRKATAQKETIAPSPSTSHRAVRSTVVASCQAIATLHCGAACGGRLSVHRNCSDYRVSSLGSNIQRWTIGRADLLGCVNDGCNLFRTCALGIYIVGVDPGLGCFSFATSVEKHASLNVLSASDRARWQRQ